VVSFMTLFLVCDSMFNSKIFNLLTCIIILVGGINTHVLYHFIFLYNLNVSLIYFYTVLFVAF